MRVGVRARWARLGAPLWLLAPLLVTFVLLAWRPSDEIAPTPPRERDDGRTARVVLVIVDSLRPQLLEPPIAMPGLARLAERGLKRPVTTCSANFTLPCVRTMLEGRQSPFAASLHNFTGAEGGVASVPKQAAERGLGVLLVSDHTLGSLYGQSAASTFDANQLPEGYLSRDLAAITFTEEATADGRLRFVALHVAGTDKVAHYQHPGSPAYAEHFLAVDEALARWLSTLDLERESVVVTGDHGHDESGHHQRSSVAVLAGPKFRDLAAVGAIPDHLDQTEIAYLLSYAAELDLDVGYEGRHLLADERRIEAAGADRPTTDRALAFLARQRAVFTQAGFGAPDLGASVARHRASVAERARNDLYRALPLLALYVGWVAWAFHLRGGRDRRRLRLHAAAAAAALATGFLAGPAVAPWIALAIAGLVGSVAFRRGDRRVAVVALLIAGAALAGAFAKPWAELFHTRGGASDRVVFFYFALAGAGALLALVRGGGVAALPFAALAVGYFVPPSGVYYYHFNQTLLWGFALGAAVVGAFHIVAASRSAPTRIVLARRWPWAAAFVLASTACLLQEAGGWEYHLFVIDWLNAAGPAATNAAAALGVAVLLGLSPTRRARGAIVAVVGAALAYSVVLADLELSRFAAALGPVAWVGAYLRLTRRPGHRTSSVLVATDGLLVLAGATAVQSALLHGLSIQHIDWSFGYRWLPPLQTSRDTFLLLFLMTALKYGLPVLLLVAMVAGSRPAADLSRIVTAALLFANLKMAALFLTIAIGRLDETEKLYELTIGDVMIVPLVMVLVGASYAAIAIVQVVAPRLAGRAPPLQKERGAPLVSPR